MSKPLKKLTLKKKEISSLTKEEMEQVSGGFFKSQVLCFQTMRDRGCTYHTKCGPYNDGTFLCIKL